MDLEGEIEFTEFELLSFEHPDDFERYLYELDAEHDLNNVDSMLYYYNKKIVDLSSFVDILIRFKTKKNI